MSDSVTLIDMFVRGIGAGAMMLIAGFTLANGVANVQARAATALASLSIACWLVTESHPLWAAFGHTQLLMVPAMPVGGCSGSS